MGKASRDKGKRGERELAEQLRTLGLGPDIRRGQQFSGREAPDIVNLPGIHAECKRVEALNIWAAMKQAISECPEDKVPAVFHRRNNSEWLVTMRLEDWAKMKQAAPGQPHPARAKAGE